MEWALKMKGERMRNPVAVLLIAACLALPAGASSLHLTENGDIEQPLTTGWDQSIAGTYLYIVRGTAFDADPDYEVRVSSGVYFARVTGEDFSSSSKLVLLK